MNLGTKVTEYFLSSKGSVWIHISKHFNELPKTVQGCMAKTDTSKYKDINDIFVCWKFRSFEDIIIPTILQLQIKDLVLMMSISFYTLRQ